MKNITYNEEFFFNNGWAPVDNIKKYIPSLYNIHLKFDNKNETSIPSKNIDKNKSSVFIIQPKDFLSSKEGKNVYNKLVNDNDYLSSLKLETIFYVIDKKGSEHRNHEWHFDTFFKTKIILHVKGCNPKTATQFLSKSHKSFYPQISSFFAKISKNKILLSKNGCYHLPFFKFILKKFKNGTTKQSDDGVIFNTNTIHKAGNVDNDRHVLILHFQH